MVSDLRLHVGCVEVHVYPCMRNAVRRPHVIAGLLIPSRARAPHATTCPGRSRPRTQALRGDRSGILGSSSPPSSSSSSCQRGVRRLSGWHPSRAPPVRPHPLPCTEEAARRELVERQALAAVARLRPAAGARLQTLGSEPRRWERRAWTRLKDPSLRLGSWKAPGLGSPKSFTGNRSKG